MLDLDMTRIIDSLFDGSATPQEQKICAIALKSMIQNKGIKPVYENGRPRCPRCTQALNTKLKDGKHIFEYCKCCGQHINWEDKE